jgi:uncharacterized protein YneF (UPF0154 family)
MDIGAVLILIVIPVAILAAAVIGFFSQRRSRS